VTQVETDPANNYVQSLVNLAETYIDLDALLDVSRDKFFDSGAPGARTGKNGANTVRIGVAYDKAFCFYYYDNFDILRELGAELIFFSPLKDKHLPEGIDGLYIGGGYPEVHAGALSENVSIASEVREVVESGLPVYAECGGLIYLSRAIEDFEGSTYRMSGALPIEYRMQNRATLGYREATSLVDSVLTQKGERLRGHEFHYSTITRASADLETAYELDNGQKEGFIYKNTLATYVHLHFAAKPAVAERFISFCRQNKR
jgi:cobyrinic acid a,c-diamide synthase